MLKTLLMQLTPEQQRVFEELSPVEKQTLYWLSQGESAKDIARYDRGINVWSVRERINKMLRKLGVRNTAHMVALYTSHSLSSTSQVS